jgi:hypothetical protein
MSMKAKEIQKARQSEWQRRETRRGRIIAAAWIIAGVAFVGTLVYLAWKQAQPIPRTGESFPIQGRSHIEVGAPHDPYNSDPPTSGPHYEQWADAGFYEAVAADEQLVHNLEHGYVIIWYNCSSLSPDDCSNLKNDIRDTMGQVENSPITHTPKLIAMPRPTMDRLLALTSWGRLDKFDAFDRQRILNFIRVFRDVAPEPSGQ